MHLAQHIHQPSFPRLLCFMNVRLCASAGQGSFLSLRIRRKFGKISRQEGNKAVARYGLEVCLSSLDFQIIVNQSWRGLIREFIRRDLERSHCTLSYTSVRLFNLQLQHSQILVCCVCQISHKHHVQLSLPLELG